MNRREMITTAEGPQTMLADGVGVHILATGVRGARGLTTSLATFAPRATLPYHRHPFGEVIVVLCGLAAASVEGRRYELRPFDALYVPANVPHCVTNRAPDERTLLHSSFASESPVRELVEARFEVVPLERPEPDNPERVVRFAESPVYELASRAQFRDLFAARLGSRGICGGYGRFEPGASLPCHYHKYDESITIVEGRAVCLVAGRQYELSDNATAYIPTGLPHRFLNRSERPMAMIRVYAGDEPGRTIVDAGLCAGSRPLVTFDRSDLRSPSETRS